MSKSHLILHTSHLWCMASSCNKLTIGVTTHAFTTEYTKPYVLLMLVSIPDICDQFHCKIGMFEMIIRYGSCGNYITMWSSYFANFVWSSPKLRTKLSSEVRFEMETYFPCLLYILLKSIYSLYSQVLLIIKCRPRGVYGIYMLKGPSAEWSKSRRHQLVSIDFYRSKMTR